MRDVAEILVPWAVVTLALFLLIDLDERRLRPRELARAWPPASRTLALVYFGVPAVPVHFWRTRRTAFGTLVGVAWGLGAAGLYWGVSEGLDALPDAAMAPTIAVVLVCFTLALILRARQRAHGSTSVPS
jgi:hypothetical protein